MFLPIFQWFETRTDPFPEEMPEKPGTTLSSFVYHYSKPFIPMILVCSAVATATALIEVSLFAFLGSLVDWLSKADRATFWQEHGTRLTWLAVVVLFVLPVLKFFYEMVVHQGLMGNFAMRIRWQAHRYVLRQSMEFFHNDFAGRVATKVMQTALAVRDMVLKLTEVLLYVAVYFTGALVMFATSDIRLAVPMVVWLAGYTWSMWYFVPKLRKFSEAQADARSILTGRVVDSYTNISTVKLFAHAAREDLYAKDGMEDMLDTVYGSMRMTTLMTLALNVLNSLLLFSISSLAIWLWYQDQITTGAIAFTIGLMLRMQGMAHWIIWEVAGLFENIGVVQDGIETMARDRSLVDAPGATELKVPRGEIRYENVSFNYGKDSDRWPGDRRQPEFHHCAGRKGRPCRPLRCRQIDTRQPAAALLRPRTGSHSDRRPGHCPGDAGIACAPRSAMVTQDTSLLHRSVIDNIRYGRPDASMAETEAAARKAHAAEFIAGLEDPQGRKGYRGPCRRARRETLRRPAPARRHRPRAAQGCADPDAR